LFPLELVPILLCNGFKYTVVYLITGTLPEITVTRTNYTSGNRPRFSTLLYCIIKSWSWYQVILGIFSGASSFFRRRSRALSPDFFNSAVQYIRLRPVWPPYQQICCCISNRKWWEAGGTWQILATFPRNRGSQS